MTNNHQRYLIIFDINGTLIDRLAPNDKLRKTAYRSLQNKIESSMTINQKKIFLRPKVVKFFKEIEKLENIKVATWTTGMEKNMRPVLDHIFPSSKERTTQNRINLFHWFQNKCTPYGYAKYKTLYHKDLEKVFKSHRDFSLLNTIIVDDSIEKFLPEHLQNHFPVKTFDISTDDAVSDNELWFVLSFLEKLNAEQPADVRLFLQNFLSAIPSAAAAD